MNIYVVFRFVLSVWDFRCGVWWVGCGVCNDFVWRREVIFVEPECSL